MTTTPDVDPADLCRVMEAFSVVTVALEGDDGALGRHVVALLAEIDERCTTADDRGYETAMLLAGLGSIAALALKQWAVDEPAHASEWIQLQAAHFEANAGKDGT